MENIKKSWLAMFTQYDNVPAIAPTWYKDLKNGLGANTGNDTVNKSVELAYNEYTN